MEIGQHDRGFADLPQQSVKLGRIVPPCCERLGKAAIGGGGRGDHGVRHSILRHGCQCGEGAEALAGQPDPRIALGAQIARRLGEAGCCSGQAFRLAQPVQPKVSQPCSASALI